MLRTIDFVMIGLLLGGAAFTFKVKYDSEQAIERVQQLEAQIRKERDAIDILRADWALLSNPRRLERLAELYVDELELAPVDPSQIGTMGDIPMRSQFPPAPKREEFADLPESDSVTTGSVKPESGARQ